MMTANPHRKLLQANPDHWDEELQRLINRYVSGAWRRLGGEGKRENQVSLERGFRILSAYTNGSGTQVWVITEADRSCATCLQSISVNANYFYGELRLA